MSYLKRLRPSSSVVVLDSVMTSEAEEEITYWRELFFSALAELKTTHVNVYGYTLGRPPSPRERLAVRKLLKGEQ